jgi:hypothetical protein
MKTVVYESAAIAVSALAGASVGAIPAAEGALLPALDPAFEPAFDTGFDTGFDFEIFSAASATAWTLEADPDLEIGLDPAFDNGLDAGFDDEVFNGEFLRASATLVRLPALELLLGLGAVGSADAARSLTDFEEPTRLGVADLLAALDCAVDFTAAGSGFAAGSPLETPDSGETSDPKTTPISLAADGDESEPCTAFKDPSVPNKALMDSGAISLALFEFVGPANSLHLAIPFSFSKTMA